MGLAYYVFGNLYAPASVLQVPSVHKMLVFYIWRNLFCHCYRTQLCAWKILSIYV